MNAEVEKVERRLRCPRCMGDGKHYPEVSAGEPKVVNEEPCPDCKGEGEGNVDHFLTLYLHRAQAWKQRADRAEAILKRVELASKEGESPIQALIKEADAQRRLRIERAALELVQDLRTDDEPPAGLAALEWALMGGDPDVAK